MAPADSTSKPGESSTATTSAQGNEESKKTLPQLGALEEDDEFEEFEAEDWDDSEASLSQITTSIKGKSDASTNNANAGNVPGAGKDTVKTGLDSLWEDNWDDDDIEDDFSVALRKAISEHNGPQPMSTS